MDSDYHPFALAEEVNAFMEAMGLSHVVMVGNSLGGAVSARIAAMHPDKVDKMVLLDAVGYPMKLPLIVKIARLPISKAISPLIYGRWMIKWNLLNVYHDNDKLTEKNIDEYYSRLCTENAVKAQILITQAVDLDKLEDHTSKMPGIRNETLVVHGENDPWVPLDISYSYRRDIPNSIFVKIPSCGHVPQEECPEATAKLIIDFIKGNEINESPIAGKRVTS